MAAFVALGIEAMNVAGHFHQFGGRQLVEIADDGFDYAHAFLKITRHPEQASLFEETATGYQ